MEIEEVRQDVQSTKINMQMDRAQMQHRSKGSKSSEKGRTEIKVRGTKD